MGVSSENGSTKFSINSEIDNDTTALVLNCSFSSVFYRGSTFPIGFLQK